MFGLEKRVAQADIRLQINWDAPSRNDPSRIALHRQG